MGTSVVKQQNIRMIVLEATLSDCNRLVRAARPLFLAVAWYAFALRFTEIRGCNDVTRVCRKQSIFLPCQC